MGRVVSLGAEPSGAEPSGAEPSGADCDVCTEVASVRGHSYVVRISFTYLVHYRIILPIPPQHTGYLQVDLILVVLSPSLMFYRSFT